MSRTATNVLILQCGGPTAVVNASLAAVMTAARDSQAIDRVFGCRQGWDGLGRRDWVDLTGVPPARIATLRLQPGAALGSGRVPLEDHRLAAGLRQLAAHDIGIVLVIGGNGTMAAAHKLEIGASAAGLSLRVVGVPKTIDNDLHGTDAAPGYGSAARFVAQSTRDMALDLHAMRNFDDVVVVEWMGRHVGWLAAAAALARRDDDDLPQIILLPERACDEQDVLDAVARTHTRHGMCMVATSEGIQDRAGLYWAAKGRHVERDASGQQLLSLAAGVAPYLAQLVQRDLGLRCRQVRPDTLQRSSRVLVSDVDRRLAEQCAAGALAAALTGASGVLCGLQRSGPTWSTHLVPFSRVIGRERSLPAGFLSPTSFDVTQAFLDYARPLAALPVQDDLCWI